MSTNASHEHDSSHHREPVPAPPPHVLPLSLYWGVFIALIGLTVLTYLTAVYVDIGPFNLPLAILIASIKAALVGAVFMHLWFDHKQNAIVFGITLLFLAIFIVLTMFDTENRGIADTAERNFLPRDEVVEKYREENPNGLPLRPGLKPPEPNKLTNPDEAH